MTLAEYQRAAAEFAEFAPDSMYPFLGLAEEAGEACGKVAKSNIAKLADRKARGVIVGEGDNR